MVDPNRQLEPAPDPEFADPEFDRELRRALEPRSASPDFVTRLMQQIPPDSQAEAATAPAPKSIQPRRARIFAFPPALRLAAIASLIVIILAGSFAWQQHQRRIAGERARQQVMTALQITHATLQQVAENVYNIQNRKDIQP